MACILGTLASFLTKGNDIECNHKDRLTILPKHSKLSTNL